MSEPTFWTCDDSAEYLDHSDQEAVIEEFLDNFFEMREPTSKGLARMPEKVTVYGYSRRKLDDDEPALDPNAIIERILEDLDEEYGSPAGDHELLSETDMAVIKERVDSLIAEVRARYYPFACEQTHEVEVDTKAWIKEHREDWLEDAAREEIER